jgi:hypothetical protein
MRSVCFFMVYHKRPNVTRMAIDHMCDVINFFREEGLEAEGIVIGNSKVMKRFCKDRDVVHHDFPNDPVSNKFTYAWFMAVQADRDYICWLGSNNLHSDGYWETALQKLKGNKVATFGTRNCVIMSADPERHATCLFNPSKGYLISSGQFFLTYSFAHAVNILTLYDMDQQWNFDGTVLDCFTRMWGQDVVEEVSFDEEDCLDIKTEYNIHSYESYMKIYPEYEPSSNIIPRFPRLGLLVKGFYD